ncbi:hypothetical protein AMJ80_09765 [bacterium SM23_31]|nr:MAG: hypothetical protein AMJ80_09765 [bacterium SM23_31]
MKVKFISSVLFSMFLFAVMNLLFGLVHNANAQQQRISFQGKYGVQLPYKLVEETSIPPNARLVKLSRRSANTAGYVKIVVPYKLMPDARQADEGFNFFDANRNIIYTKTFETRKYIPLGSTEPEYEIPSYVDYISKYGNYVLVRTSVIHVSPVENLLLKFEIFDDMGRKRWEEEVTRFYDQSGPFFYISDYDGRFVKIAGSSITFYDPQGTVIKDVTYSPFELYSAAFSDDGNYFVMNSVNPRFIQKTEPKSRFHLFDKRGEELWRYETERQRMSEIFISPNGEYVLGSVYDMDRDRNRINSVFFIFRNDGTIVREYEDVILGQDNVFFSPEGKHAAIWARGANGGILLVALETGEILYSLDGGYSAADVLSEKKLVAFANDNRLVVLKLDGTPVFRQNYKNFSFSRGNIYLRLSENGEEIFILSNTSIFRYRLQK